MPHLRRLFVFPSVFFCYGACAAENDVCVTSAAEFQSALTNAQAATEPTLIKVTIGTYNITSTLTYSNPTMNQALTIEGGYSAFLGSPCGVGFTDPTLTILDGGQQQPIMSVTRGSTGSFTVKSLTFQHGLSTSDAASSAALDLGTETQNVTLDVENNIFIGNSVAANSEADVVTLRTYGSITALNNVFVDNNLASGFGWLISSEGSAPRSAIVNNNTISGNSCSITKGYEALFFSAYSPATVENNIILDNPMCADAVFSGGGSFVLDYNDLGTTYNATAGYGGTYQTSNNLASVAPNFVGGGSYQLSGNSPLVDAGSNAATGGVGTSDAAGHTRIVAIRSSTATVDIGAYELQDDIFKNGFE